MKNLIIAFLALLINVSLFAQAPEKLSYQAVIRDADGKIVANQKVGIQITILQGHDQDLKVYSETHNTKTNKNGLITLEVGAGEASRVGDFYSIAWENGPHYIRTESDLNGGVNYTITGISQLLSVPYALHAKTADRLTGAINSAAGNKPKITDADTAYWNAKLDAEVDGDTTNELQVLSMSNDTLYLTEGGHVVLSIESHTDTNRNVAVGKLAIASNTVGYDNSAMGYEALYSNTQGFGNSAMGYETLYSNTTGAGNSAMGSRALYSNTSGTTNSAIGYEALYSNTSGYDNTAIGRYALYNNTSGLLNSAIGSFALLDNTTGWFNSAMGVAALQKNTGWFNSAMGFMALNNNTTGGSNTAMGSQALEYNTTGNFNSAMGYGAFSSGNYSNSSAFGYGTSITASNQVRLGNSSVSSIGGYANWSNVSDARMKSNVIENVPGLLFITKLRPVTYNLDMDAIAEMNYTPDSLRMRESEALKAKEVQTGFIAQEVEQVAKEVGYNFSGVDVPKDQDDHYGLRYAEFVVPLVKAVQEQQVMIEEQKLMMEKQKEVNAEFLALIEALQKEMETLRKQ